MLKQPLLKFNINESTCQDSRYLQTNQKKKKNFNETSNIRIVLPECLWAPRPRPVELKMSQHAHEIGESHVTVAFIDDKL